MSEQENLQIVRHAFDAWNAHDPNHLAKLFDEKYVEESDTLPERIIGPEGGLQVMRMYIRAFPDLHFVLNQMIASGDYVVTRWTATGTHRGDLMGIPATGKQVTVSGITISHVKNGKVVEEWSNWDTLGMLQQLGVVPEMAGAQA